MHAARGRKRVVSKGAVLHFRRAAPAEILPVSGLRREEFSEHLFHMRRGRKKLVGQYTEGSRNAHQLEIRNTPELRLDLRERAPADVPSKQADTGAQLILSESLLVAEVPDFWTDGVLSGFHLARKSEDASPARRGCYVSIAQFPCRNFAVKGEQASPSKFGVS